MLYELTENFRNLFDEFEAIQNWEPAKDEFGNFVDDNGNKFYFANNSYSSDPESVSYTVYMRYENKLNNTFVEGTIRMSYYEDFYTKEKHNVAH